MLDHFNKTTRVEDGVVWMAWYDTMKLSRHTRTASGSRGMMMASSPERPRMLQQMFSGGGVSRRLVVVSRFRVFTFKKSHLGSSISVRCCLLSLTVCCC